MRTPKGIEMKTGLKKGTWSVEEDQMLISYISRYGIWNWSQMPRFAGLSRSGKSCRLRWLNYLNPNIRRGNFSKEEEEIILHSHSLLGNRWSAIAARLPGRTDNEVKNHWHAHLKKRKATNRNEDDVEETQHSVSESSFPFEDDMFPSTSEDQQVNYYVHPGSPGTVDDLRYFWQQLLPFENLELGNVFYNPIFQDSYADTNTPCSF